MIGKINDLTKEQKESNKIQKLAYINIKKRQYDNSTRKKIYQEATFLKSPEEIQSEANKRIKNFNNLEKMLRYYESNKFYLSTDHLMLILQKIPPLLKAFLGKRKNLLNKNKSDRNKIIKSLPKYDKDDRRISSLIENLSRAKDLTDLTKINLLRNLAKLHQWIDVNLETEKVLKDLLDQNSKSIELFESDQLVSIVWVIQKVGISRKNYLGIVYLETERRIKRFDDLGEFLCHQEQKQEVKVEELALNDTKKIPTNERLSHLYRFTPQKLSLLVYAFVKLNATDEDLMIMIFKSIHSQKLISEYDPISLYNILVGMNFHLNPSFNTYKEVKVDILGRLDKILELTKNSKDKSFLTYFNSLTQFSFIKELLNKDVSEKCQHSAQVLTNYFFETNLHPSPKFTINILGSFVNQNLQPPKSVLNAVDDMVKNKIDFLNKKDLTELIILFGKFSQYQKKNLKIDIGLLFKILLTQMQLKGYGFSGKNKLRLKGVKNEIEKYSKIINFFV